MEVIVRRQWTPRELAHASEAPGRPDRRMAGGWIADETAQRHLVSFCSFCVAKFNPKRYGYVRLSYLYPWSIGRCDGCKQFDPRCRSFVAEETWEHVVSPRHHGRRGRWGD